MPTHSDSSCLLVDADTPTRHRIAEELRRQGYTIQEAALGTEALELLRRQTFAIMVLEPVHLGMKEGELLRAARELDHDLHFIICTANPTIDSTIAAIRENVFDYLLKPCQAQELKRSLERALDLRAKQARQERLLSMVRQVMAELEPVAAEPVAAEPAAPVQKAPAGWLDLDREKRMVTLRTSPPQAIELTEGETALLSTLMENPDRVLTCTQLAHSALGYNGMDKWTVESVIRSSIFRLRQKLEPSPDVPKLIHTLRGRGYYFSSESKQPANIFAMNLKENGTRYSL